jgi:preprotein translocase subunit SecD
MRPSTLVWIAAVVASCRSGEQRERALLAGPHLQLVYDIDLDAAVAARMSDVKLELEAQFADEKIAATVTDQALGTVTVVPSDPAKRAELAAVVKATYRDTLAPHDCAAEAGPAALCFVLGEPEAVKRAELARAVATLRARIARAGVETASVTSKGEQIVVALPALEPDRLASLESLLERRAELSFHVVANDAPYMKRLYARAGSGDAAAAGIEADVDRWRRDDGTEQTDYYLRAHDREEAVPAADAKRLGCLRPESCLITGRKSIEDYVRGLAAQDPSYVAPDDLRLAFEPVQPAPEAKDQRRYWRTYWIERSAALTGASIADAKVARDPDSHRAGVLLELDRNGTRAFGELTTRIVGKKLAIILDHRVASAPIVNGPMRGGRVQITMGPPGDQDRTASELAIALKTGALHEPIILASQTQVP